MQGSSELKPSAIFGQSWEEAHAPKKSNSWKKISRSFSWNMRRASCFVKFGGWKLTFAVRNRKEFFFCNREGVGMPADQKGKVVFEHNVRKSLHPILQKFAHTHIYIYICMFTLSSVHVVGLEPAVPRQDSFFRNLFNSSSRWRLMGCTPWGWSVLVLISWFLWWLKRYGNVSLTCLENKLWRLVEARFHDMLMASPSDLSQWMVW